MEDANQEGADRPMEDATVLCRVCAVGDLTPGQPHRVDIAGHEPVAVYKVGDQIFVTDDTCTHGKASLGDEGELDGFTIICTWHDGAFDIRTGEVRAVPCTQPIRTYPAILRDGAVHIALPAR
jgi:nitrite reductase/ring-hydroxylating ferredoxin subunit